MHMRGGVWSGLVWSAMSVLCVGGVAIDNVIDVHVHVRRGFGMLRTSAYLPQLPYRTVGGAARQAGR
jgi:hypothetical protein